MSPLAAAIAPIVHAELDPGWCEHDPHTQPECERVAEAIVAGVDWDEVDR